MTSKQNKLSTPTKPAPVELHDEALDAAAGGTSPAGSYSYAVTSGALPSGANIQLSDGSVRLVK